MNKTYNWLQKFLICNFLISSSTPAIAQITPDNTLGAESSRLTPNVPIAGENGDRIDGGATRGSNLFHSFSQFNLDDGQRVYFGNPSGIQNILTRVTGGNASNILGTLGVDGGANLFLINPNGIIFGQNARLDLRGSFVGTTANAIGFGEQGNFSATNPAAPPLLTVNPSALLFTQLNGASIISKSIAPAGTSPTGRNLFGLRVPDGQSLQLIGGDVEIDGGGISGGLTAQGGRIELGGLAQTGAIALDNNGRLTYPSDVARSNVSLINNARVGVRGIGGGDVVVNANDFTATNGGRLTAGTEGTGNAGDITVNANTVNFVGVASDGAASGLNNVVLENGTGTGGNITVNSNSFNASSGAGIDSGTLGSGNSGNVIINTNSFNASSGAGIDSSTLGSGNSGNVIINTNSFNASSDAVIDSSTFGSGNSGNVIINARDIVALDNAAISSSVEKDAIAQGGDISITTGSLFLTNGAQLATATLGQGDAGNVEINARDITFQGSLSDSDGKTTNSGIYTSLETGAIGNAGDVRISTNSLSILDNAAITTFTRGKGNAGNVFIDANDRVSLKSRSSISSSVQPNGVGQGGTIQIRTESLSLADLSFISSYTDGQGDAGSIFIDAGSLSIMTPSDPSLFSGYIAANTTRQGNAGNITINVRDTISMDRGAISTNVLDSGSDDAGFAGKGKGGDIRITTGSLQLTNEAQLSATSSGQGDAGNIFVNAGDTVSLDGGKINTFLNPSNGSPAVGRAGDIQINARSLFLTNGGVLNSTTNGQGNAGNIVIRASDSIVIDRGSSNNLTSIGSAVLPNGVGRGGDIQITTGSLSLVNNASLFAATGGQGDAGNIIINARDRVSFSSGARLFTNTSGQGNAGNVTIGTGDLSIDGVSQDGNSRSGIFSIVEQTGVGRAGNIDITADSLSVTNGGVISAATSGQGKAGDITIQADSRVSLSGTSPNGQYRSAIATETTNTSKEAAGNLTIATKRLSIRDGAIISAATLGQGRAGDITINASDSISLSGLTPDGQYPSAITTGTTNSATGDAGNLNIATSLFDIRDGAGIFAATFGQGRAGDVTVQADSLFLNRGQISTQTASTNGGNITLTLNDTLLLRNNSLISTTAGTAQAGGDGGNITINSPFIIALPNENSDITANAFSGRGGKVDINARIFGIQQRSKPSPQTSDITASSELGVSGQIDITEPNVQPTQGLVELPGQILDASDQIASVCPNGNIASRALGEFVVSGRGSLPPNPLELLVGTTSLSPLATLDGQSEANISPQTSDSPTTTATPQTIVEAQGWVKTADGKIALVAHAPQATPNATTAQPTCPVGNPR